MVIGMTLFVPAQVVTMQVKLCRMSPMRPPSLEVAAQMHAQCTAQCVHNWMALHMETCLAGEGQGSAPQPHVPAAAHVATDQANPQVCVGAACAAAAGVGVAAEHAVPAHRARGIAPVLDALPVEPVVAHLHATGPAHKHQPADILPHLPAAVTSS
jgi:hypothetical protein